jgi:FixJ family two-component response regulator
VKAMPPTVFVVDDDASIRKSLARLLGSAGFVVRTFASATDFLNCEEKDGPGCLVLDVRMPGLSGLDLQEKLASVPTLPIVFITGHGDVPMSVRAMKRGAADFLQKPFDERELLAAVDLACEKAIRAHEDQLETSAVQRRWVSSRSLASSVSARRPSRSTGHVLWRRCAHDRWPTSCG